MAPQKKGLSKPPLGIFHEIIFLDYSLFIAYYAEALPRLWCPNENLLDVRRGVKNIPI